MMGSSHALSGAALWLAGSWVVEQTGIHHQTPIEVVVGAAVCAGAALLPDLDMSGGVLCGRGGATIAKTFGRASLFVAEVVEKASLGVYRLTATDRDPDRENGHRTLTHTLPFAAAAGAATTGACALWGRWAAGVVLFLAAALALRGLLDVLAERAGWVPITITSAVGAYITAVHLQPGRGYPLLGVAVTVGCVAHLAGDVITRAGIPILWPFVFRGRRWWMVGVPDLIAVKVGGKVERLLIQTACGVVVIGASFGLAVPDLPERIATAWTTER